MFDDPQLKNTGQVPPNLPLGEAEDMFADTDTGAAPPPPPPSSSSKVSQGPSPLPRPAPRSLPPPSPPAPAPQPIAEEEEAPPPPPSALGAGILRPKGAAEAFGVSPLSQLPPEGQSEAPSTPREMPPPPPSSLADEGESYQLKEPIGRKSIITWIVILIFIVILGGGSIWLYFAFIRGEKTDEPFTRTMPTNQEERTTPSPVPTQETGENQVEPTPINDADVLFGTEVLDTDNDSLDDVREKDIGSDPLNWDTDGDELGDGDEVIIWKTDPLNSDTDGDTYKDGAEVKNGYNPAGTGKLFEPPAEEAGQPTS